MTDLVLCYDDNNWTYSTSHQRVIAVCSGYTLVTVISRHTWWTHTVSSHWVAHSEPTVTACVYQKVRLHSVIWCVHADYSCPLPHGWTRYRVAHLKNKTGSHSLYTTSQGGSTRTLTTQLYEILFATLIISYLSHEFHAKKLKWRHRNYNMLIRQIHPPWDTVNVVIFAGGKFRENIDETFQVGVNFAKNTSFFLNIAKYAKITQTRKFQRLQYQDGSILTSGKMNKISSFWYLLFVGWLFWGLTSI